MAFVPDDGMMILRLLEVLEQTDFGWSLCLMGEDQASKLAQLSSDLQAPLSRSGDGKHIASGFSYWGIESSVAWAQARHDPYYPVMRKSIETFPRRWRDIAAHLEDRAFHFVALGPGTGEKEQVILRHLRATGRLLSYIPVDLSIDMLRMAVHEATRDDGVLHHQVFPVQLDFEDPDNLDQFRELLDRLTKDEPVLFALLGNTLANFDDDALLLRQLGGLLREQDRFVLEVASTRGVTPELAEAAANEYGRSRAFWNFVTSTLTHKTDLPVNRQNVEFLGVVEEEPGGVRVNVVYRNDGGADINFRLADGSQGQFPANDTIRLYVTRKYLRGDGFDQLLRRAGLAALHVSGGSFAAGGGPRFGMDVYLLRRADPGEQPVSSPPAIWD